jgi:hypothetical protein
MPYQWLVSAMSMPSFIAYKTSNIPSNHISISVVGDILIEQQGDRDNEHRKVIFIGWGDFNA